MKINNMIKKSGLAIAISAMSAGAFAGVHSLDVTPAPVLANEIFGAGSEDTLVAVPTNTYEVTGGSLVVEDVDTAGEFNAADATVKYTLDKGAVFGEPLSDIQAWADSNATLIFSATDSNGDAITITVGGGNVTIDDGSGSYSNPDKYSVEVDQGGAIGDNTVTFKITNTQSASDAANASLDTVQIGQFRIKNLTSALERASSTPQVRLGAEFRNVATAATDTQSAIVVLRSQDGVKLTGNVTDYSAESYNGVVGNNGGRARIDVADSELSFTGDDDGQLGDRAGQDFDETDNVAFVNLGDLQVVRTTYDDGAQIVNKENGDDFDFQGSDTPVVTLTSDADLGAFSSIYLNATDSACGADVAPVDAAAPVDGSNSVDLSLSGQTTAELEAGYNVCATADGQNRVPESSFKAELNVNYFNPRYTTSYDNLDYGKLLRNGCQVTLFNLPNTGAQDNAFVRLTNVSDLDGAVRASIWTQDGELIDEGTELQTELKGHATTVLHTNPDLDAGVYLGDAMPAYGAVESGRHRLVVQGAFPACEALGLIRSPNGTLTNMTSTTYSGDEGRLGTDTNGTSNTSN